MGINIACINLASIATFLAQKVRPRTWWDAKNASKATKVAVVMWLFMPALLMVSSAGPG